MKIKNHILSYNNDTPVDFRLSPNRKTARLDPRFLIVHYTAGGSFESTVKWFENPAAKASAHIVIGRDGEIVQMVRFDQIAWHAGISTWNGFTGINNYGIGIELDNAGKLEQRGLLWFTWFNELIAEDQVLIATPGMKYMITVGTYFLQNK
jgi:N-acetylmuramoyl-L-alanine amidase